MSIGNQTLRERLASVPDLGALPREELEWLVTHGRLKVFEPGIMYSPGQDADDLFIILSGRIAVHVDRGLGPRRVMEWTAGQITGRLPFSRMEKVQSDIVAEGTTEIFLLHQDHFPELIYRCPHFAALTVHTMIDRTRGFSTSYLQDEKMVSLGRLAAGLAHELNNPASAAMRGAKVIRAGLSDAERASRALCGAGLSEDQISEIERTCAGWLDDPRSTSSLDREREVANWLASRKLDSESSGNLADAGLTAHHLDELSHIVPTDAMGAVLEWLVAGYGTRDTARDVERAAKRIADLVAAMKRFTNMDRVSGPEAVDVNAGLYDTIEIMQSRARSRGVSIALAAAEDVPRVRAVGSELNQVWANLIENAIDALHDGGEIRITLENELHHVVVRVIDDGPGIQPEILSRIFDPFFTTKAPGHGVGLGLEIARQLLWRYGGEISVRSEPGHTEFTVRLPALQATEVSSSAANPVY
jgi:signal transduction histidine kinase